MGIIWSWAFGEETYTTLQNLGFSFSYPELGSYSVNDAYTYSYPGEAAGRSSLRVGADVQIYPPLGLPAQGTVSIAFLLTDILYNSSNAKIMDIDTGGKNIKFENQGTATMKLKVDSEDSTAFTVSAGVWHWLTLKYDARTAGDYKARAYLDGVAVTSEIIDTSGEAAGESNSIYFDGVASTATVLGTTENMWLGAIVISDDYTDPTEVPRFVTRVQPTSLESSAGSWSAVNAPTVLDSVTGSMINSSSYALNTTTIVGNNLLFEAGTTIDAALGVSASYVDGVTMHFVASGSGPFGQAQLSDNSGGSWATGSNLMLTSQTGYGYGTAATRPQAGGAWSGSSDLYLKYEAS